MPRLFTDPPDGWSGWADRLRRVLGECAAYDGPLPEERPLADAILSLLHRVAADAADCGWPLLADGLCDVETVGDLNKTELHPAAFRGRGITPERVGEGYNKYLQRNKS